MPRDESELPGRCLSAEATDPDGESSELWDAAFQILDRGYQDLSLKMRGVAVARKLVNTSWWRLSAAIKNLNIYLDDLEVGINQFDLSNKP